MGLRKKRFNNKFVFISPNVRARVENENSIGKTLKWVEEKFSGKIRKRFLTGRSLVAALCHCMHVTMCVLLQQRHVVAVLLKLVNSMHTHVGNVKWCCTLSSKPVEGTNGKIEEVKNLVAKESWIWVYNAHEAKILLNFQLLTTK